MKLARLRQWSGLLRSFGERAPPPGSGMAENRHWAACRKPVFRYCRLLLFQTDLTSAAWSAVAGGHFTPANFSQFRCRVMDSGQRENAIDSAPPLAEGWSQHRAAE
ncbi:hypothetical protein [Brucella sp. JSBI001]|uniref:hypothetical protein n=1 Tax=Brucella sp. JSBI001 TaxID=2886044 RepID=UPI0022305048|nr:hypothetical protein LJ361_13865 [Brucella sp. JSBI001]